MDNVGTILKCLDHLACAESMNDVQRRLAASSCFYHDADWVYPEKRIHSIFNYIQKYAKSFRVP